MYAVTAPSIVPSGLTHPVARAYRFSRKQNESQNAPSVTALSPVTQRHHQWPWRFFAFASDLGTVGYLVKQPLIGKLGWLLAAPYYAYGLIQQSDNKARQQEAVYQLTANGLFPFVEAKLGVKLGETLYKYAVGRFAGVANRMTLPVCKALSGLGALLALTPLVGDPLSRHIQRVMAEHLSGN